MDLLPRLFPELKAFYCHDSLTKVIDCDSIDDCLMFLTSIFTFKKHFLPGQVNVDCDSIDDCLMFLTSIFTF